MPTNQDTATAIAATFFLGLILAACLLVVGTVAQICADLFSASGQVPALIEEITDEKE